MTGAGGMGALPSSRLARILQEKAETLKKRRLDAEAAVEKAEERIRQLEELGVTLSETAERREQIAELQHRSEWEGVEGRAKELLQYLETAAAPELEARRAEVLSTFDALRLAGAGLPVDTSRIAEEVRAAEAPTEFAAATGRIVALRRILATTEETFTSGLSAKSIELAKWAELPKARLRELETRLGPATEPIQQGAVSEGLERVRQVIRELVPEAAEKREAIRAKASAIVELARELGSPSPDLENALATDADAFPTRWRDTVTAIESASERTANELRDRVRAGIEGFRTTLTGLEDQGAEPTGELAEIDELLGRVPSASATELPGLLQGARDAAEGPVVAVVVSLLDEVRPRLVQARQLGRDPTEVFASMNRAREALRLHIFSEALAASRDALDRVSQLTSDLDEAREEAASLRVLIERLGGFGIPTSGFRQSIDRVDAELNRIEVEKARADTRETVRALGSEAARFFTGRMLQLQNVYEVAHARGFLPAGLAERLSEVRRMVEEAALPDAGERLAAIDVEMRTAAGPYIARRVEEIESGFGDDVDAQLTAATRRYLADADVSLRVKEDLGQALESLRRAEHEATLVFAAHAANLVERLEAQHRALEEMGGASPDILRQIDEVQQIFNMGDFSKASHTCREILARMREQQTSRGEEAISHAKLALVELGKVGVAPAALRRRFDEAQEAHRQGKLAIAYRAATEIESEATQLRASAQSVMDRIAEVTRRAEALGAAGVVVEPFLLRLGEAQTAFLAQSFASATSLADEVAQALEAAADGANARRLLDETSSMLDDARKLAVPTEEAEAKLSEIRAALDGGRAHDAAALASEVHDRTVGLLKPVAAEHIKTLEQDIDIARGAGLDVAKVVEALGEARRLLVGAVPARIADRIEGARTQLLETRGFLEHAELAAKRVRDAFAQAEILHIATPEIRERVDGLDQLLSDREYARVIEAAGPLERTLLQLTSQHVARVIAGMQGTIVQARHEGSPTTVSENLLGLARQALQQGRPLEALQLVGRSEGEVERFGLQTRLARGAVDTLQAKIARMESDGIRLPAATDIALKARESFDAHELIRALELAIGANDTLDDAREAFRRAREALDAADRQVKEAMEFGADVAEVVALLEEARRLSQAGSYLEAGGRAREAADLSRWAIERLYSGSLAQVRELAEMMRSLGAEATGPVSASLEEAEVALQGKEWKRAADLLDRARSFAVATLDRMVDRRIAELEDRLGEPTDLSIAEVNQRGTWKSELSEARDRRDYARAFELLKAEETRATGSSRAGLEKRLETLKECLWVGEKLGLDTTPAMERFSEARLALAQGNLGQVPALIDTGTLHLEGQIEGRIPGRAKELETELIFARDGLHVALGDLEQRLGAARRLAEQHQPIESARALLEVEEQLNVRKVRHRELANLHYLIGAALQRASDRQLDTTEAHKLLEESILSQEADYDVAIVKARAALQLLEGIMQAVEPQAGSWPFRRRSPG